MLDFINYVVHNKFLTTIPCIYFLSFCVISFICPSSFTFQFPFKIQSSFKHLSCFVKSNMKSAKGSVHENRLFIMLWMFVCLSRKKKKIMVQMLMGDVVEYLVWSLVVLLSFWLLDAYLIMLPVLVCPFFQMCLNSQGHEVWSYFSGCFCFIEKIP